MQINLSEVDRSWEILQNQARSKMKEINMEKWKHCLGMFMEKQQEIDKVVSINNLRIGSAGSDTVNLLFNTELDMGEGPVFQNFVARFGGTAPTGNEFRILKGLFSGGVRVARPFWVDENGEILPEPAYIMGFLDGEAPLQSYFTKGILAKASPESRKAMIRDAIKCLAEFHAVDPEGCGLEFLRDDLEGGDFIEGRMNFFLDIFRQIDPKGLERFEPVIKWLRENKPVKVEGVVCHGDANLSNFMFSGKKVTGIIDIGSAFIGPREIDLTELCVPNTLFAVGLGETDGVLPEKKWVEEYEKVSGYKVRDWEFYRIWELFRLSFVMCWFRAKATTEVIEDTKAVSMYWENMLWERMRHIS